MEITVGVDIVEIDRIASAVERWGERFLNRVYTEAELAYCQGRAERLAARFAAKEAVMKALGTGLQGVGWLDVEVVRPRGQAPTIALHGRAVERAQALDFQQLAVSLSHSRAYAVASVVGSRA